MARKSQLAVFAIIAIVLFASVAFLIFSASSISRNKTNTDIKTAISNNDLVNSLKSHISSCIESSSEKGLMLLGEQGGYIYPEQGSYIEKTPVFEQFDGYKRAFWLLRNKDDTPPGYPLSRENIGIAQIPVLQKEDLPLQQRANIKYSVKEGLLQFFENDFKQCVNLSSFTAKGMSITNRPVVASVIFADSGTIFKVSYPIDVKAGNLSQKISDQEYSSKVRFKALYTIAKDIIYQDKTNLFFIIDNKQINEERINPLSPVVIASLTQGREYDTFRLTDNIAPGQPYELVFLRQNRNPVLNDIMPISINASEELIFMPKAIDPDEDDFNITIVKTKRDWETGEVLSSHIVLSEKFITTGADVGFYEYNVAVTDEGGLKDWQNNIEVKIYCELPPAVVSSYDTRCCNPNWRIYFDEGKSLGSCTCRADGTCT